MLVDTTQLRSALTPPRKRATRDRETATSLDWAEAPPLDLPAGMEMQWLGTAGFRLSLDGTTLLIDPYVSRADIRTVASRRSLPVSAPLLERHLPKADAVLVGHTHFDHALDVPAVVARDGCPAYGSDSLVTLLGLHGLADRAVKVTPHQPFEVGPFKVTFVPSRHSKLLAGLKVPSDGDITCAHLDGLHASAFCCGQVWGILVEAGDFSLYHQGSADLLDDEVPRRGVDVFLFGIAGRLFTQHYLDRILSKLSPDVVVPQHWDNFFLPLDDGLHSSLNVNLYRFPDEVAAVSRDFEVRTLVPLQTVQGGP